MEKIIFLNFIAPRSLFINNGGKEKGICSTKDLVEYDSNQKNGFNRRNI
jgi:hypothetical protein